MSKLKIHNSSYNLLDSLSSSDSDLDNVPRKDTNLQLQEAVERNCDSDESDSSPKMARKQFDRKIEFTNNVIQVLVVLFVLYILYLSFSGNVELFTWHPPLMTIGWTCFLTQGILSLLGENCVTKYLSHKNKIRLHWILQMTATITIFSGSLVVFINKNLKNKHHLATWHAIFGLGSIICLIVTSLNGILALYNMRLKDCIKPIINKTIHAIFGTSMYVLGSVTMLLAFYSHWFTERANIYMQIVCILIILLVTIWTLLKPVKCIVFRMKLIYK